MLNVFLVKKPYRKYISILTAVNVIIIVLSLCIFAFGIVLEVNIQLLKPAFDAFVQKITQLFVSAGLGDIKLSSFEPEKILQKVAFPVTALGAYSVVLAVFGIIAAKRKSVILLIMYLCLESLGLLLQASSLYVLFGNRKMIDKHLKPYALTGLQENYRGYNETDLFSLTLNVAMVTFRCCGIDDYTDFKDATNWRRKLFQDGWWFDLKTPLTCCNMEIKEINDFACAVNPSDSTSYYIQGCYEIIWEKFYSYKVFPLAFASFLMTVQLTIIIASIMLIREIRKIPKKESEGENKSEASTNDDKGLVHSMRSGLLNNLPFTGLSVDNNDTFQQSQGDDRKFSVRPDLLAAFLLGSRRFSQTPSYDCGLPQGRMPPFDFEIRNDRNQSFDFGIPNGRIPSFDFGRPNQMSQFGNDVSQGPILVNLPQNASIQPALKAITQVAESSTTTSEPTIDVVQPNNTDSNSVRKIERCKSENCINRKAKPILKRQKTSPSGIQASVIQEEES